ncbi:MAG: hypothetical protein N2517_01140 [Ignavibacteria bacterium]|nr:hypothetical protein [Ignavibacteria bacterium]
MDSTQTNNIGDIQNRNSLLVQREIQIEQFRQATGNSPNSLHSQLLQMLASNLPSLQQIHNLAQAQISKGFLDIKV